MMTVRLEALGRITAGGARIQEMGISSRIAREQLGRVSSYGRNDDAIVMI